MWHPQRDVDPDPSTPRWLVPWVYPIGMVGAGIIATLLLLVG